MSGTDATYSFAGVANPPAMASYNAAKAAVISLSETLRFELFPEIGVSVACPSFFKTDLLPVYKKAKAAGAEMVLDIADMSYGGRAFTCRDPEGHIWNVGSYDPWADSGSA